MWTLLALSLGLGLAIYVAATFHAYGRFELNRNLTLTWSLVLGALIFVVGWAGGPVSLGRAGITAALLGAFVFYLAQRRRWLTISTWQLQSPRTREAGFHRIMAFVSEKLESTESAVVEANNILRATNVLIDAGFSDAAKGVLEKLPIDHLHLEARRVALHNLAIARLHVGDVIGARAALRRIAETHAGWMTTVDTLLLEGLVLAHEGDGAESLNVVEQAIAAGIPTGGHEGEVMHVKAHAKAALGELDEARALLRAFAERRGADALRTVSERPGPARAIARSLVNQPNSPYRSVESVPSPSREN